MRHVVSHKGSWPPLRLGNLVAPPLVIAHRCLLPQITVCVCTATLVSLAECRERAILNERKEWEHVLFPIKYGAEHA